MRHPNPFKLFDEIEIKGFRWVTEKFAWVRSDGTRASEDQAREFDDQAKEIALEIQISRLKAAIDAFSAMPSKNERGAAFEWLRVTFSLGG